LECGFHFHFINDDNSRGGHVFGLALHEFTVELHVLHGLITDLIVTEGFYHANLLQILPHEVVKVEQLRS
jgi:alpha-acetolactate decarboxylase